MNGNQTILVVDDNENDLQFLRSAFKWAQFNCPIQSVHNGREAMDYLGGKGKYADRGTYPIPVVILLDLKMPMADGFEVLAWVRSQPLLKRMVLIVLTASMRVEDVDRAFELGTNAFLVKPPAMNDLIGMMRTLRDWLMLNHFPTIPAARLTDTSNLGRLEAR